MISSQTQYPLPSKFIAPFLQEKKNSCKSYNVSSDEIFQIHTTIKACGYKGPWGCMKVDYTKEWSMSHWQLHS
jgi:hypothetical protein